MCRTSQAHVLDLCLICSILCKQAHLPFTCLSIHSCFRSSAQRSTLYNLCICCRPRHVSKQQSGMQVHPCCMHNRSEQLHIHSSNGLKLASHMCGRLIHGAGAICISNDLRRTYPGMLFRTSTKPLLTMRISSRTDPPAFARTMLGQIQASMRNMQDCMRMAQTRMK